MQIVKKNEVTATYRRMYFHCVDATDGMTPETGEVDGQPQISVNGGAFADTGIGVLVAIGSGRYYAELTQEAVNIADRSVIEGRYKSANTAEAVAESVQVLETVPLDVYTRLGAPSGASMSADIATRAATGDAMTLTAAYDAAKTAAQPGDPMDLLAGTITSIVAGVWASGVRTLTSFGALATDIWAAGTRTLTSLGSLAPDIVAGILGSQSAGVLQRRLTVKTGSPIDVVSGDYIPEGDITFDFGTDWDLTGKEVWFCVKATKTGSKLIDVKCTVTDAVNGRGRLPDLDLAALGIAVGDYFYEYERVNPAAPLQPRTVRQGKFIVSQGIR